MEPTIYRDLWAIGLGLLYGLRAFGPTEAEVVMSGQWSVVGGVVTVVAAWIPLTSLILSQCILLRSRFLSAHIGQG